MKLGHTTKFLKGNITGWVQEYYEYVQTSAAFLPQVFPLLTQLTTAMFTGQPELHLTGSKTYLKKTFNQKLTKKYLNQRSTKQESN